MTNRNDREPPYSERRCWNRSPKKVSPTRIIHPSWMNWNQSQCRLWGAVAAESPLWTSRALLAFTSEPLTLLWSDRFDDSRFESQRKKSDILSQNFWQCWHKKLCHFYILPKIQYALRTFNALRILGFNQAFRWFFPQNFLARKLGYLCNCLGISNLTVFCYFYWVGLLLLLHRKFSQFSEGVFYRKSLVRSYWQFHFVALDFRGRGILTSDCSLAFSPGSWRPTVCPYRRPSPKHTAWAHPQRM